MKTRLLGRVGVLLLVITLIFSLACAAPVSTPVPSIEPAPPVAEEEEEAAAPAPTQARVVLFWHESTGWDVTTTMPLCTELGFSSSREDYAFINNEANFFDEKGKRKFDLLFFAGGDANMYFAKSTVPGIDERGCQNIRKFISKGGSCIATCYSGCTIFTETSEWIGLYLKEAMAGAEWEPFVRNYPGLMVGYYGGEPIFRGTVRGPQESNMPHPLTRFLPIKLNTENSIVKKTNLPNTVYLCTIGSGSLIPNPDQAMEVIGWFPNGTAAMGVVKYGDGHLYMIAPHPSMTLENSGDIIRERTMGTNARRWGWSEEQIKEAQSALDKEGDPDGPDPDLILMKAILKDAADRASTPAK